MCANHLIVIISLTNRPSFYDLFLFSLRIGKTKFYWLPYYYLVIIKSSPSCLHYQIISDTFFKPGHPL